MCTSSSITTERQYTLFLHSQQNSERKRNEYLCVHINTFEMIATSNPFAFYRF